MLRNSKILFALLVICLTVLPVAAQQNIPGGKWWQMPAVAKRLNLSARETRQIDDTYRESRRRMIRLKADLETEQMELQCLIEDPELNEPTAMTQYRKLDKARSELGLERFRFFLEVRKIVGHERFNTLMRLREMRQKRMMRGGDPDPASGE